MSVYRVGSNKSSFNNYPNIKPTLNLDFANSKTLDPRITFTRNSGGSYIGSDGLVKFSGVNEPRFDHDPDTGESLGLLIEETRTNLILDSGGNYNYNFNNDIYPVENDLAPDGTIVPCKYNLFDSQTPFLNIRTTNISAGTYTMSMWIKSDTENVGASYAFVGETIIEIPNTFIFLTTKWKRYIFTFTLSNNQTTGRLQLFFAEQGVGKKVSVWGAQLERGPFATSYIPRVPNQQSTRVFDNVRIIGSNFRDWYRQDEGTLVAKAKSSNIAPGPATYPDIAVIWDGTSRNYHLLGYIVSVLGGAITRFNDTTQSELYPISRTNPRTGAYAYKRNDFATCYSGGTPGELLKDTSGNIPTTLNQMQIGDNPLSLSTIYNLNGTINFLRFYPKRLSDNEMLSIIK